MKTSRVLSFTIVASITVLLACPQRSRAADDRAQHQDDGSYMVFAKALRGQAAFRLAEALASEIREEHNMPAFVYRPKVKPGESPSAMVFVGFATTLEECREQLKFVRQIKPKCLPETPWGKPHLRNAYCTDNPLIQRAVKGPKARNAKDPDKQLPLD